MVNVLLVDDHELVRMGIERLLAGSPGIKVVGVACSGEEAIRMVGELRPDVVLMDVFMPGIGGIEASRKINLKYPEVKVIALSASSDGPLPRQLLDAGARGYVSKSCSVGELVKAVTDVHCGRRYLSSDVAIGLALSRLGEQVRSPFEHLSWREMQIVMLTLQGKGVADMARQLMLSPKTVSTYRHRVFDKLGVKNDVELVHLSLKHKLNIGPE